MVDTGRHANLEAHAASGLYAEVVVLHDCVNGYAGHRVACVVDSMSDETPTPISRALFAPLEGVDTRSVSKAKWDEIIKSHLRLELELTALRAERDEGRRRLDEILDCIDGMEDIDGSGGPNLAMRISMIARGEDKP
jgi:hypothetical protein